MKERLCSAEKVATDCKILNALILLHFDVIFQLTFLYGLNLFIVLHDGQ